MPKVSEEHLEAKREIILHAALACFARDGFHKTKMSDIAEMAGVSDGLAYRYFSSKDEIIQEAVQMVTRSGEPVDLDALGDDIDATIDMVYGASVQRFSIPERGTTVGLRMRSWSEALENEEVREQVLARWAKYAPVEEEIWSKARNQGRLAEDLDLKAVTQVMQAIHDGLDLRWALDPSIDVDACYDVVLALIRGRFSSNEEDE
jgi:AcrR family transcriptional regulator